LFLKLLCGNSIEVAGAANDVANIDTAVVGAPATIPVLSLQVDNYRWSYR